MPAAGIFSRPFGNPDKDRERTKKTTGQGLPGESMEELAGGLPVSAVLTMKKHSFYVWFLGAQESGGLRGDVFLRPALASLLEREKDVEPVKVTLQISSKGLKIVQNVSRPGSRNNGKTEQVKHLIPGYAVTCVTQARPPHADVVCCILLVYNPVTRCPHHVHAYRCDSVETATSLRVQLEHLVERPENRSRFEQVEARLGERGGDPGLHSSAAHLDGPMPPRETASRGHPPLTGGLGLSGHHGERTCSGSSHRLIGSDGRSTRTDDDDDPDLDNMDDIENKIADDHLDDLERSVCEEEALPTAVVTRHTRPPDRNHLLNNHNQYVGLQSQAHRNVRGHSAHHGSHSFQPHHQQQLYHNLQGQEGCQISGQSHQSQSSQQTDQRPGSGAPVHSQEDDSDSLLPRDPHVARLYDSLAQELKEKLAGSKANSGTGAGTGKGRKVNQGPLLLPPKDYDTVCRRHGNLQGIDLRRSTIQAIVGQTLPDGFTNQEDEGLDYKDHHGESNELKEHHQRPGDHQHISQSSHMQNSSGPPDGALIISSPRAPKTPNKATRLASNSSGKSSGIGSDEMLAGTDIPLTSGTVIPVGSLDSTPKDARRGTADAGLADRDVRKVGETPLNDTVTSSDDEWNYRPAHRLNKEAIDVRGGHNRQRPPISSLQQHRSMDFLHQRLEHFHMGEVSGHQARIKASSEGRQQLHRSTNDLFSSGNLPLTLFGKQCPPTRRSLSNYCLAHPQLPSGGDASSTDVVNKVKGSNALSLPSPRQLAPHERPISFPMGVNPQRRDIPLAQPPPRFGFHQHPLRESMIEPVPPGVRRPLSPGERRESLQMTPAVLRRLPVTPMDSIGLTQSDPWKSGLHSSTGASAYFSRRPVSPVTQNNANTNKRCGSHVDEMVMGPGLRGSDMRRQSLATDSPGGSLHDYRGNDRRDRQRKARLEQLE
ncbi:uncharacterized protein LOC111267055 isoform X3 [Varroa jacobsoni]|uniref:uncharacterized protein LOC111267055 isoform X3 n=1 Tax=Varroa jacobsoni TaxID=62625 RepID=UPI000BF3AF54|nr:uncharacterized protein LOC111267055 isoform X3 [Varroa jacobsoni]